MDVTSGTQFAQLLMRAFEVMVADVRASLEEAGHPGLTVTNELAMQAIDNGASSAASLARETGVSRQAAAKTINTLETLGYVTRDVDPADARKKSLRVTPAGRAAIAVGAAAFDRVFVRWERQDEAGARAAIAALQQLIASGQVHQ
ncbi:MULTISPECIES: MarR family winged helix-turn-helix transcriptional regulator [unclassified Curtobacterium]|jgi:DNA-binding MarR family transcriptional regulator|uniref:MarR family winged helix-turn-helix transcriptional regulator n=1 Tax=unclassified Curtobacterium TaxID=257496 RepID=UPI000DAA0AB5|nr:MULTISPECIES: helix-turn-helix domain-containing protein [unclassified Curtobacterium]MDF2830124.1 MarR family transcriptional regulator [Mycobacterium sp.]PZF37761.1 MarR family transcriptional regulator [Curtobacterium sp. MCLR17_053]PZF48195.1 MarR family transcriptional regulator [Curtobacterium sp. MCLR17_051]